VTAQFSRVTRELVRARSEGRCDLCGMGLIVGHFHHRQPRGMGGTRRIEASGAANCLLLHPRCHADVESNRQRSIANGWLVPQSGDPAVVPVKTWRGLVLLLPDGTVTEPVGTGHDGPG
jgi:hypothetical protein